MSILVWLQALKSASTQWDDRADDLRGAHKTLVAAEPSLLGSRVAKGAQTFLTAWSDEIERLRDEAERHSDALVETVALMSAVEQDTESRMQALLPWDARNTSVAGS